MSITVGTDTYITVAEADDHVELFYPSTDAQRLAWADLDEADKEVALRKAAKAMNTLKYTGCKVDDDQALAFPRCYVNQNTRSDIQTKYLGGWDCQDEVPEDVKEAQAEEALELAVPSGASSHAKDIQRGITSKSVLHATESYAGVEPGGIAATIANPKAQRLLEPYMGGGYEIVR